MLQEFEEMERDRCNSYSRTSVMSFASLLTALGGLAGGKSEPVDPNRLMPFPKDLNNAESRPLAASTRKILKRLYDKQGLNATFWGAIAPLLEELLTE